MCVCSWSGEGRVGVQAKTSNYMTLDPGVEPEASRRRDSPDAAQSLPEDSAERPDERGELLRRRVIQEMN